MRFFFSGTLIDPDVRRLVMGATAPATVEPAVLAGWARRGVRGAGYPVIVARAGASVDGVLARSVGAAGRRRLVAYEGPDYDILDVEVTIGGGRRKPALVFVPARRGGLVATAAGWDYETWARRRKRAFLREIAGER